MLFIGSAVLQQTGIFFFDILWQINLEYEEFIIKHQVYTLIAGTDGAFTFMSSWDKL